MVALTYHTSSRGMEAGGARVQGYLQLCCDFEGPVSRQPCLNNKQTLPKQRIKMKFCFTASKQKAHAVVGIVGIVSKNLLIIDTHVSVIHAA